MKQLNFIFSTIIEERSRWGLPDASFGASAFEIIIFLDKTLRIGSTKFESIAITIGAIDTVESRKHTAATPTIIVITLSTSCTDGFCVCSENIMLG